MSYSTCVHGGGTCTGCMDCYDREEVKLYCADCGDEIDPDDVYEVDGETLCKDCVLDRFRIPA